MDLQEEIMEVVKKCPQAMFIFDEVDKMPETLVDGMLFLSNNYQISMYIFIPLTFLIFQQ